MLDISKDDEYRALENMSIKLASTSNKDTMVNILQSYLQVAEHLYNRYEIEYKGYERKIRQHKLCLAVKRVKDSLLKRTSEEVSLFYIKLMRLCSRRLLHEFITYLTIMNGWEEVWGTALKLFSGVIHYTERMIVYGDITTIFVNLPPNSNKSFLCDLIDSWQIGADWEYVRSVRTSYSEDLMKKAKRNIISIITSDAYGEVFPYFSNKDERSLLSENKQRSFIVSGSNSNSGFKGVTRGGQISGERTDMMIIDDLLKGHEEANSIKIQADCVEWLKTVVLSRQKGKSTLKLMFVGTLWSENDVAYKQKNMYEWEDTKFKYTKINKITDTHNKQMAVDFTVPLLDENGKILIDYAYTEDSLSRIRSLSNPDEVDVVFECVYQQNPISSDSLEFFWSKLKTYTELPSTDTRTPVYAVVDPNRKGKNYLSMPIIKQYDNENEFHLIDFIYSLKATTELIELMVEKIIAHEVTEFLIEENTDTSLSYLIDRELKNKGYYNCNISTVYQTKNKELRIMGNKGYLRNNIIYPDRSIMNAQSQGMRKAMEQFTTYSFDKPNKFDDAIDALSSFCDRYIKINRNTTATVTGLSHFFM